MIVWLLKVILFGLLTATLTVLIGLQCKESYRQNQLKKSVEGKQMINLDTKLGDLDFDYEMLDVDEE